MGRNSTLQPISEFGGGGLNLIVCQLVDCRFCKKLYLRIVLYCFFFSSHCWVSRLVLRSCVIPYLKVVRFIFIIQVNFLLEDGEWISNKEVCNVLGQQLVNPYAQKLIRLIIKA